MQKYQQKGFIHLLAKSNEVSLTELANVLGLTLSSFRVTLDRSNLMLHQFLTIYEHVYKKEYETDSEFLDIMRELYDFSLRQYVEAMKVDENKKVTITLYKKTNIQLIN